MNQPAKTLIPVAAALLLGVGRAFAFPAGITCESGAADAHCEIPVSPVLTLETRLDGIVDSGDTGRYELQGDITLVSPAMRLPMAESKLVLEVDPDTAQLLEMYGTARVPLDRLPLLDKATFDQVPTVTVGLMQADTINELFDNALPLNTAQALDGSQRTGTHPYLVLHADAGLSMKMDKLIGAETGLSFNVPAADPFTVAIDTLDPYIYMSKSLTMSNKDDDSTEPETVVIAYEIRDADGNVETMVYEHYDQQGTLVKKYLENLNTANIIEHVYDSDGHLTVTFFEPDGNGGYRQEGSDGTNGRMLSADEVVLGKTKRKTTTDEDKQDSNEPFPINSVGFSAHGWIPFKAQSTFGIPVDSQSFAGQLYLGGEIPMGSPFVVLEGDVVTYVGSEGLAQGGNGTVSLQIPFLSGIVNFAMGLGNASAALQVTADKQMTYFSGELDPDTLFFDDVLPVFPKVGARAAGYLDNNLGDSHITIEGTFDLGADVLGNLIGVSLNSLASVQGSMDIGASGVLITGTTTTQIHPALKLGSAVSVRVSLPWASPDDVSIELRGDMEVFGVGLKDVLVSISKRGMLVNGAFVTPLTRIALSGSITDQGPSLTGTASVLLGLGDITGSMKAAADALTNAQNEVNRLQLAIDDMRAQVQSERDGNARNLRTAQSAVTYAQGQVDSLNGQIAYQYARISARRSEIASWKRWLNAAAWYQYPSRAARYAYEAGWRNAEIAGRYITIGTLGASMVVTKGTLELAKLVLQGAEAAMVYTPIDLDPRVAGLITAHATAMAALEVAKAPFAGVPMIPGDFAGSIAATLDIAGIRGKVTASFQGYSLLQGSVNFGVHPEACIALPGFGNACTAI
jgi:hypothetical protein